MMRMFGFFVCISILSVFCVSPLTAAPDEMEPLGVDVVGCTGGADAAIMATELVRSRTSVRCIRFCGRR